MLADRRAVLMGAAALISVLAVAGCAREAAPAAPAVVTVPLDLSALEARHGGRLGLAVSMPGKQAAWRGDERFVYCSTFKMYLAAATLLRVQAGQERLDRAIPITAADMVPHAPTTGPAVGAALTVEQLMKAAVQLSDNPAANILIRELGGLDAFRAFYRGLGDDDTRVDRLEPELNRADGDKDTITPNQSARNIERMILSETSPLESASKRLLLEWMVASPTGEGRIKAGVPAGWTVAHKTGTGGDGPINDIGVIYPTEGDPIVIAIYFHATDASTDAEREAVVAEATRQALKALGHG